MPDIACNNSLHATYDLLQTGLAFQNPISNLITGCGSLGQSKVGDLELMIAERIALGLPVTDLTSLKLKLVEMVGASDGTGFSQTPLGDLLIWTDFSSGKSQFFPFSAGNSNRYGQIANIAILGSASILTILAMANGDKARSQELCQPSDPDDPCANVGGIFGSVLGAFNDSLAEINSFLQGMVNYLEQGAEYIEMIEQKITQIVQWITDEITKMVAMILKAINYGLAKIFEALKINPCLAAVLHAVGTNELRQALNI